jgi:carbon-monoxide dehydrogenase medium subunit
MVLAALGGEVVARNAQSERRIKAEDLFAGPLQTTLASGEILTEIRFPVTPAAAGSAVEEFARRRGDFAIAAVAAVVAAEGERCLFVGLGAAGLGPVPLRLRAAERVLEERGLDEGAIAAAAREAAGSVDPLSDLHASADYRRHLCAVLLRRALGKAVGAAREKAARTEGGAAGG